MIRKLFPVLLALLGLGGGLGAGLFLRPAHDSGEEATDAHGAEAEGHAAEPPEAEAEAEGEAGHGEEDTTGPEYVKMNNQFVVPVVDQGRVAAMVVLSLSIEVEPGNTETIYAREPKLRDAFLQVLFDHANMGGFNGTFTDGSNLIVLRTSLKEAAALLLGPMVRDVLITDIARQDS